MKKLLIILILLGFSCSVDQGAEPCNPEHNLETDEATNINANSARFSGSITIISLECPIPGGAQQGFVLDINNSPTVDDTVIIEEEFNDVRETDRIPIDDAMKRQVALLEMDYQWV